MRIWRCSGYRFGASKFMTAVEPFKCLLTSGTFLLVFERGGFVAKRKSADV